MLTTRQIVLHIAEKVREVATRQGNVPFRTGDLRKSIVTHLVSDTSAVVGSNLPYARAVHDGRRAITIRPKNGKVLKFTIDGKTVYARQVRQKARRGRPFLLNAVVQVKREGLGFLKRQLGEEIVAELERGFRATRT